MNEKGFLAFAGGGDFRRVSDLGATWSGVGARIEDSRDSSTLLFRRGMPLADHHGCLCLLSGSEAVDEARRQFGAGNRVLAGLLGGSPVYAMEIGTASDDGLASDHEPFDESTHTHACLPEDSRFESLRGLMASLPPSEAELAATGKSLLNWHRNAKFCGRCGGKTAVACQGWQRRCANCKAVIFPRTNPVVIMLVEWRDKLLVGRSYHWPKRMYSLLAGFIEPGETVEAAVRRETMEETGVEVGEVKYVASQPWPFPASLMIGCRAIALGCQIRTNRSEIENACWLGRNGVLSLLSGDRESMRPPLNGSIARHLMSQWLMDRLR
ncbi:MAG: NAD(+) diphosphatase [Rhodobacteraceae bacterium]|nr:NAD(+) diphosphatase [Paracoccaceae bacterium]